MALLQSTMFFLNLENYGAEIYLDMVVVHTLFINAFEQAEILR